MAYKKLIKVSNVCQLLKPNFLTNKTSAGVTCTSNGNTFTLNGTSSGETSISAPIYYITSKGVGHKFLISGCPQGAWSSYSIFFGALNQGLSARDYGNGAIFTSTTAGNYVGVAIKKAGITFDNLVIKPQLFDLTEMYGAGNEPTTVEQFRQDFPEELYDYSPYCWLTSYKRVFMTGGGNYLTSYQRNLTCKTKNLFDINSAVKISGFSSFSKNENQITVSQSNVGQWSSANVLLDTSIVGKTITATANAKTDGINKTYIRIQWLASDGLAGGLPMQSNYISGNSYQKLILSGVVPEQPGENFKYLCLMFYSNTYAALESGVTYSSTFKDIMLNLGDTATEYVPYGHL